MAAGHHVTSVSTNDYSSVTGYAPPTLPPSQYAAHHPQGNHAHSSPDEATPITSRDRHSQPLIPPPQPETDVQRHSGNWTTPLNAGGHVYHRHDNHHHGNHQHGNPHHGNPHHGNPHHGNPHLGNPHHGNPHHDSPHHGNPEDINHMFQPANVPGIGPVLILTGSHFQSSGYQLVPDHQRPYIYPSNQYRPSESLTGSLPLPSNASSLPGNMSSLPGNQTPPQGSPVLYVKSSSVPHMRNHRSGSQPPSGLKIFHSSSDNIDIGNTSSNSESGLPFNRRYSSPPQMISNPQRRSLDVSSELGDLKEEENVPEYGGFDLSFVLSPDDLQAFKCPICHLIFRNPYLTDCCGGCFCYTCINRQLIHDGSCPLCGKTDYETFINRNVERKVNSLPVKCPKADIGCKWVGPLSALDNHIDATKGDCQFILSVCPHCNKAFSPSSIERHKYECDRRPFSCKFCSYEGVYEDMPNCHWPVCQGFPVPCPNDCGEADMPRRDMEGHLAVCPKGFIDCPFKNVGCLLRISSREVEKHKRECVNDHMMLMNEVMIAMTVQLQENERLIKEEREKHARAMDEREREINSLKQQLFNRQEQFNNLSKELSVMFEDNEDIRTDINNLKSSVFVPPYSFIVRDFHSLQSSSKQWFSQPFYTHINGYKMCISVDCNGSDEGAGSHVSVYANLMCGEFDDQLNWPFCGSILIRLKNQFSDKSHIEHDIPFSRDVSAEIGGRVTNQELAESGLGVPRFVSLKELNYDSFTGVGYIKHNSLSFCVCSVRVANICV